MVLFRYIENKDAFRSFYITKLSERLMYGILTSDEREACMISKLKESCGSGYTGELQRMLTGTFPSPQLPPSTCEFF
jgi:cullin 1